MVSPFFANAFPLYSVVEKVELKAEAVKEKVAGAVGAAPTGVDLYSRFALAGAVGCAVTHGEFCYTFFLDQKARQDVRNGGRRTEAGGRVEGGEGAGGVGTSEQKRRMRRRELKERLWKRILLQRRSRSTSHASRECLDVLSLT